MRVRLHHLTMPPVIHPTSRRGPSQGRSRLVRVAAARAAGRKGPEADGAAGGGGGAGRRA